ncbi:MAG: [FeFe] hydrogenase H-cluster radical SAM maturase HydG [Candidatus Omnitrophica bacterium]|nr:[FeFe] hydrogenase H-cluster radical SAM maturase HydG [Candidatus Omnitrophota bacterium]
MNDRSESLTRWISRRIQPGQIVKYTGGGGDFIDDARMERLLHETGEPDKEQVKDIVAKSLAVETLSLKETALLLAVKDPDTRAELDRAALAVKKKVYDNRIVTFAPLYLGNYCVNDCLYCGFRTSHPGARRKVLSAEEIREEAGVLAGKIGHKRLIVVYGEHPQNDTEYMERSIKTIYGVKEKTRHGYGQIRRVNVNAPPLSIEDLIRLREVGIGTYQVFQETYHHSTYRRMHPSHTVKGDYQWRLYSMHRAFDAGVDDVGLGALFGLYDWRFEVLGLVAHSHELEARFGIGPHTISFPRLEPAANSAVTKNSPYRVNDEDFLRLITVIRLAVPYTGMIITARETPRIRSLSLDRGITQTDASTRIGIGGYSDATRTQDQDRQQFLLGDTRSLDELIREFAQRGLITSFCTAGYRCGRTGKCIMDLLRTGQEGKFCKLNAVLTFREWIDDFASEETQAAGERVLDAEIDEIRRMLPAVYPQFIEYYERIKNGERDLYF